jgi:hypothetical protein
MFKWIIGFLLFVALICFGGYKLVMNYASDKIMNQVSNTLAANEEEVNKLLEDPEIQSYIEEGGEALKNLPFTTKKEAMEVVSEKYSVNEMVEMRDKVREGLTSEEKAEIYNELQSKFTEEELQALKIVALKEMQKNNQ